MTDQPWIEGFQALQAELKMSPAFAHRVLITGSRDWADEITIHTVLEIEWAVAAAAGCTLIVVHGDAEGADRIAREWVEQKQRDGCSTVDQEAVPADWERPCDMHCYHKPRTKNGRPYSPVAGNLRNQIMVDRGANVCYAFPLEGSRGTKDCMARAKKAGIEVHDRSAA